MKRVQEIVDQMIIVCERFEVDGYQLSFHCSDNYSGTVRNQTIENLENAEDVSFSVMFYKNHKRTSASTCSADLLRLSETAQKAYDLLPYVEADSAHVLPNKTQMAWNADTQLDHYHPDQLALEQAISNATQAEAKALGYSPAIFNSEGSSFSVSTHHGGFANSLGFQGFSDTTSYNFSAVVLAKDAAGAMQYGADYSQGCQMADIMSFEQMGANAAKEACDMLGAKKLQTQHMPVILKYNVAKALVRHFLSCISGYAQYRKESFLQGAIDKICMPDYINITEHPLQKGSLFSAGFDGEGIQTSFKHIVQSGALKSYLLDQYTACKLGMSSTGNAGGFRNVRVEFDKEKRVDSLENLCALMGQGFLVTSLMGDSFQPTTGNYSTGASGFWVENGRISHPVEGVTIAGNLKKILASMRCCANDARPNENITVGSLLLEGLSVSGT